VIYDHLWLAQEPLVLYPVAGIQNFTNAERYKLIQVSKASGANPELVAATISIETAGTFDPKIKNPTSTASGLFQWIKSTAMSVHGLTPEQIRAMNACAQLDLIRDYYKKLAPNGIKIPGDEYVAVAGGPLGAPDSAIAYPAGSGGAAANTGWDVNKDGAVTVGEIRSLVLGRAAAARKKPPIYVTPESCSPSGGGRKRGNLLFPLFVVAAAGGAWWYREKAR
jgi:hypothetical protein